jgi:hypothetical protein
LVAKRFDDIPVWLFTLLTVATFDAIALAGLISIPWEVVLIGAAIAIFASYLFNVDSLPAQSLLTALLASMSLCGCSSLRRPITHIAASTRSVRWPTNSFAQFD